jgi:hypothetical protein
MAHTSAKLFIRLWTHSRGSKRGFEKKKKISKKKKFKKLGVFKVIHRPGTMTRHGMGHPA